jgi:hypothetical protein
MTRSEVRLLLRAFLFELCLNLITNLHRGCVILRMNMRITTALTHISITALLAKELLTITIYCPDQIMTIIFAVAAA